MVMRFLDSLFVLDAFFFHDEKILALKLFNWSLIDAALVLWCAAHAIIFWSLLQIDLHWLL